MIRIEKVNKYFNRHKKNEIHVINTTSLTLKSSGLVALIGPSGCGKTTLLNAIGGLDKVNNGKIFIDGKRITKKRIAKVDEIRNLNIGYIFQDYLLLDHLTVFDNIALVLKMIGIKDKKEITKRVNYVLEIIGMYRYRNRYAGMLSGGERQRVGIARAIVKDPKIIIADEPTGNLDSRNSLEIMNIIKAISKDRLVILVTHETNLAEFYASRIIEIRDGVIVSDKENNHEKELDYRIDNKIYLKDLKHHELISKNNIKVNYFSEQEEPLNVEIVLKNGNIYIKNNTKDKIEVIDNNSSIELIDDHYQKISKNIYEEYKFNFNEVIDTSYKLKYSSIYSLFGLIKNGFKRLFDYSVIKKLLLFGFFLSALFLHLSISSIFGTLKTNEKDFVKDNKNYLSIVSNKVKVDNYLKYEQLENINYLLPKDGKANFLINFDNYYQTSNQSGFISGSLATIKMISKEDLLYGEMPNNSNEIVVDLMSLDALYNDGVAIQCGYKNKEDLIGETVKINNMKEFTIVGITDLKSPSIYTDESLFINIMANTTNDYYAKEGNNLNASIIDYKLYEDNLLIKKGRLPLNDYEVIVNYYDKDNYPLNKDVDFKVNDTKLKVVGYYISPVVNTFLVNSNTIKYNLITTSSNITVYPKDKTETMKYFKDNNVNIKDLYEVNKEEYIKSKYESTKVTIIISAIILLISLIEVYLMIRSSFLSRIKEVGILRAIGMKKKDIYKMFLGEIFAITTIASLLGYIFMTYIIYVLKDVSYIGDMLEFSLRVQLISIVLIYGFNIIVGLIPVKHTIRKRPAAILSRNDLE